jgi:hypothetical protein
LHVAKWRFFFFGVYLVLPVSGIFIGILVVGELNYFNIKIKIEALIDEALPPFSPSIFFTPALSPSRHSTMLRV